MTIEPRLDIIGAALADPSRSRILCELMDGRAFTNKELACAAGISAPTASAHLKQLESAGLTASLRSGRHVYHRIATAEVADVLERLASLSPSDHLTKRGRPGADTMRARSCYNHIAGKLGVLMCERLQARDVVRIEGESVLIGNGFDAFARETGLSFALPIGGKAIAKLCLDWTERRHHLSGPLATAIMQHALKQNWLTRRTGCRSLDVTESGYQALERCFGLNRDEISNMENH